MWDPGGLTNPGPEPRTQTTLCPKASRGLHCRGRSTSRGASSRIDGLLRVYRVVSLLVALNANRLELSRLIPI